MFRHLPAIVFLILTPLLGISPSFAAEATATEAEKTVVESKPKTSTTTKTTAPAASTTKPSTSGTSTTKSNTSTSSTAKTAPKKPTTTRTLDTQVSGYTSQDANSAYARLSIDEKKNDRTWYVRASITRTATTVKKSSHVLTYRLDSRHEQIRNGSNEYNVLTAVTSARDRGSSNNLKKSGYQFLSYGIGKQFDPRTKGDMGLGLLNVRDEDTGIQPALVVALRGRRPLSRKLTLNADILALQPVEKLRSTKLDSDIGFAYEMAPGFFLRLDWQATNLIRSAYSYKEWDSVIRLSVSFRRTTTK